MEQDSKNNAISILLDEILTPIKSSAEKRLKDLDDYIDLKIKGLDDSIQNPPLIVNLGTVKAPKNKIVHSAFEPTLKVLTSTKRKEKNIMMVGPAGSGKTSLCQNVSEALNINFYPMSIGQQTTKSDLLGFIDAHGNYHGSVIRQAYENGGLLLLDEFDCGHAGVITILNSLLANGYCSFPDAVIKKHKDFICICACNTYGKGADIEYIGRNRMDASTLDRFIVINIDYDTSLEKILTRNNDLVKVIAKVRENISKYGIKLIVSPRATMDIADLLDVDFEPEIAFEMSILKGVSRDISVKVLENIDLSKLIKPKKEIYIIEENSADNQSNIETTDIQNKVNEEDHEELPF